MRTEGWDYIEGLYFSFITITTIGFGDYVAGVNPKVNYNVLYRYFVEIWIYLGLAWLSLFVNWKVSMFLEVHKAIKKRRKRRKESFENDPQMKQTKAMPMTNPKDVNIFSFLSKKEETYNDLIKQIGKNGLKDSHGKILNGDVETNGTVTNKGRDLMVMYSKRNGMGYNEVKFSDSRQKETMTKPFQDKDTAILINQLDRISEEEGDTWDSKDYKPFIFQNANITFVNEEECNSTEDEAKSKTSYEDNMGEPQTPMQMDELSSFSSNDAEASIPYEQLLNNYNTVHSDKSVT
ncbi:hypothetical protein XELAEV_18026372mg [Xenopus laevis]|nr:hypothetical protein XELAEV_18026372mg [Xenopus laevis]